MWLTKTTSNSGLANETGQEPMVRDGMTVKEFILSAAGKAVTQMRVEYRHSKASHGDRVSFEQTLARVPDVEPENDDRLWQYNLRDLQLGKLYVT